MHDLVVKGGRVALDGGWRECDIGIDQGRISALGNGLGGTAAIDAQGRWVMPGGIDAHCHLDQPSWGGVTNADGFGSGSISAAFGGTTCIVPFAMPGPKMNAVDALHRSFGCAAGKSVIDYGLHGCVTMESGVDLERQFAELVRQGVTSVKVFMTYAGFAVGDDLMLAVMDAARGLGMIVMIHAENDAAIRRTRDRLIELGRTGMRYHAVAHSEVMEREATHRAVALAEVTGARIAIVHVSGRQSGEEIFRGRLRGADVIAETCPQYLFLTAADLDQASGKAARYLFSPPARSRASQDFLWQALADGGIDLWSSDHSPYFLKDKLGEGPEPGFHQAVSGIPGVETRLPLLFSEGLLKGRVSLDRYLDLTSRKAAETYGIAHRKGRIAPGLDADLAIWDPEKRWTVTPQALHTQVDFTPFEGMALTGKPETVLVRGAPVIAAGVLRARPGFGQYVPRRPVDTQDFSKPVEESTPWREM
ncbi:MAG TPA: dihydropyrimidinase [Mesorhizobium sp.]|jgi:dihydropyrimidinase|nr:dihydropyrimidinase [Mesorhizobium sp.]